MKDQFVPYELAFKLKELGFDEDCLGWYANEEDFFLLSNKMYIAENPVAAPLWQQAFDWISTEKHIDGWVKGMEGVDSENAWDDKEIWTYEYRNFNTKEEHDAQDDGIPFGEILYYKVARLKLLEKLIEIITKTL